MLVYWSVVGKTIHFSFAHHDSRGPEIVWKLQLTIFVTLKTNSNGQGGIFKVDEA